MKRSGFAAAAILAGAALFSAVFLARTDWSRALATSPLELIPESDRSAELDAVRQLAGDAHARVMLAEIRSPSGRARQASSVFAKALAANPATADMTVVNPMDMDAHKDAGKALFDERFPLLLPRSLARLKAGAGATTDEIAEKAATRLDAFMRSDTAFAFEKLLPADPLLLVPDAAAPLMKEAKLPSGPDLALLWIDTKRDPLSSAARTPVLEATARARRAMTSAVPDATASVTGVNVFADESERKIRGDIETLNLVAILAVAAVCALRLRTPAILPHAFAITVLSLATSWAVTLAVFARVHVFAVTLGALLAGVCVDFALYVMLHDADDGKPASFARIRPVLAPLYTGGLVAAAGFAFLIFSKLPAMRQTGVLAATGILAALILAPAYGSLFRFRTKRRDEPEPAKPRRFREARFILICLCAPLAAGVIFIRGGDSLDDLQPRLTQLRRTDREVRSAFGESGRDVWLVSGRDPGEALSRLSEFDTYARNKSGGKTGAGGPALMLATPAEFAAADKFVREHGAAFESAFAAALKRHDYAPEDFEPFFTAWRKIRAGLPEHAAATKRFLDSLSGPESMLVSRGAGRCLMVTWTDGDAHLPPPPRESGVFPSDGLRTLNRTLDTYRADLLMLALTGIATTLAANVIVRRSAAAAKDFAAPAIATLAVAGFAGWAHVTVSMFDIAGAFLALCCSLNYSVFARDARRRGAAFPESVTMAWLAGSASFGALAFSALPAISSLGITVVVILTLTYSAVRLGYEGSDA